MWIRAFSPVYKIINTDFVGKMYFRHSTSINGPFTTHYTTLNAVCWDGSEHGIGEASVSDQFGDVGPTLARLRPLLSAAASTKLSVQTLGVEN